MEFVSQLGSTILERPEHILSFVAHALDPESASTPSHSKPRNAEKSFVNRSLGLDHLKIVDDSDDEDKEELPSTSPEDDSMLFMSLNLLLMVLEGQ